MRKPLVAGNWKMNGSLDSVTLLLQQLKQAEELTQKVDVAVFPPYVYLMLAADILRDTALAWGGQNVYFQENGAYTGEISASMLLDLQCRYVIIGHSERRCLLGESDVFVAKKIIKSLMDGLLPILCVGETEQQREAGQTFAVIEQQLNAVLKVSMTDREQLGRMIIAYEPVWAIGTGKTPTPEQAQAVHAQIRENLEQHSRGLGSITRIIYGGSVKADNAKAFFSMPDIDGALVGGASLEAKQFVEIIKKCNNLY